MTKETNFLYDQIGENPNHLFLGDKDLFCDAYIYAVNIYEYTYQDGRPQCFILNASHNYDKHEHSFIGEINNVHELQSALRSVQLYDIAESIDLKQAETN